MERSKREHIVVKVARRDNRALNAETLVEERRVGDAEITVCDAKREDGGSRREHGEVEIPVYMIEPHQIRCEKEV